MNASIPGAELIGALIKTAAFNLPYPVTLLAETHISWILKSGGDVYKIKKPLNLGFLDYSTLELRRVCCAEELRLNRRHAPGLYLDVVPITGPFTAPQINGSGPVIDYAVHMRYFDNRFEFDRLCQEHRLEPFWMDELAAHVAAFHAAIARASVESPHGMPSRLLRAVEDNFSEIRSSSEPMSNRADIDALQHYSRQAFRQLQKLLFHRRNEGYVRECHGDLHLGNIALIDHHPTLFDGIEFNDEFRWIDVMSEIAFLIMDLECHGATGLASRFLNRYLEMTGDFGGLRVLKFFKLYRAMVRAKIALLRQRQLQGHTTGPLPASCQAYINYGLNLLADKKPQLLLMHGLSGSGKSWLAARIAENLPAIHIRSDVERKRLAAVPALAAGASGLYSESMTLKTYKRLFVLAGMLLDAGFSVIIDATFLNRRYRDRFRQLAKRHRADFQMIDCEAPADCLQKRITTRSSKGSDASDADLSVLEWQMQHQDALAAGERAGAIHVETSRKMEFDDLLALIRTNRPSGGK